MAVVFPIHTGPIGPGSIGGRGSVPLVTDPNRALVDSRIPPFAYAGDRGLLPEPQRVPIDPRLTLDPRAGGMIPGPMFDPQRGTLDQGRIGAIDQGRVGDGRIGDQNVPGRIGDLGLPRAGDPRISAGVGTGSLADFLAHPHPLDVSPHSQPSAPAAPSSDEQHTNNVIQHLLTAIGSARDPNLKASLSTALAALHKHTANFQKMRQQALQGKVNDLLSQSQGANPNQQGALRPADALHAAGGHDSQAAAMWEARHPYAMAHGQIPGWVSQYQASLLPHVAPSISPAQIAAAFTNAPLPPGPVFTAQ